MSKKLVFLLIGLVVFIISSSLLSFANNTNPSKKYTAIIVGRAVKKKIKKVNSFYFTEYELQAKKWIYKNDPSQETANIKVKILGAELPQKGIVITSSISPGNIPMDKDMIFLLENTKKKQKNVYTVTEGGVLTLDNLDKVSQAYKK